MEDLRRWHGLHARIAKDTWPNGGTLVCDTCKRRQKFTPEQAGVYMRKGWPQCHDLDMRILGKDE